MNLSSQTRFQYLGQSGLLLKFGQLTLLVDPYLSNSVQTLDAHDLARQVPIPYKPEELTNIDWVLITHEHLDHCDPHTLPLLSLSSPQARFIGPLSVRNQLKAWGISDSRIFPALNNILSLSEQVAVRSVPAAHPKIRLDSNGDPISVGYLISNDTHTIYHSGDTAVCAELIDILMGVKSIDIAFLPVNEDNFFRRERGIVGNMSIRDAFALAAELGIKNVFPVHWDMFFANGTSKEEIFAVYSSNSWPFKLIEPSYDLTEI